MMFFSIPIKPLFITLVVSTSDYDTLFGVLQKRFARSREKRIQFFLNR